MVDSILIFRRLLLVQFLARDFCSDHSFGFRPWSPTNLIRRSSAGKASSCVMQRSTVDDNVDTIDIPILYESDRLLIVNKPPGIAHHNDRDDSKEGSPSICGIVNLLRKQRGDERLWGVHRLDRVTSGILVFAKDNAMAQAVTNSFAEGSVQKVYFGVSARRPTKKKQGWIQGSMVRSRNKSWKLTRESKTNVAKTRFFTSLILCQDHKFTLLLFRPYTGKTHQLRVAAKSMGLPLWGDPIYKDGKKNIDAPIFPSRTYLHASGILLPPMLDMDEPLAVWCPPPFEDVTGECRDAVSKLMRRHCDVSKIVEEMEESWNITSTTGSPTFSSN